MFRRFAIAGFALLATFGCTEQSRGSQQDAGPDSARATQICSCPCQQIEIPAAQRCWETSCVPYCGPGSGEAC